MFKTIDYTKETANTNETAKTKAMKQVVAILNDVATESNIVKRAWIKGQEKRCLQLNFSETSTAPATRCELWVCGSNAKTYIDIYIGLDVINNHETIKEFFCNNVLATHFVKGSDKERLYRFTDINDFIPTYSTLLMSALCEKHINVEKTVNAINDAVKATENKTDSDSAKETATAKETAKKRQTKAKTDSTKATAKKTDSKAKETAKAKAK